jgi:asparagine synthetase B (glutamine-hydrolysing)
LASALLTVPYYHQPLEAGAQPMVDAQTGNRIVFNGEVYNYREPRAEL